ncbi:GIY-YIG nuclease family protein [Pseudoalteromonas sp. S16_S37]|nr:GIY-YIG nuclease family protein [Pseudoalteromonas sp. S16_S37]
MTEQQISQTSWFIYIVETRLGYWYTGITTDVAARFAAHEAGKGAKNLKGKGPLRLVFSYPVGDKSQASKLEWQIKRLTKAQKIQLVQSEGQFSSATIKSLMNLTTC